MISGGSSCNQQYNSTNFPSQPSCCRGIRLQIVVAFDLAFIATFDEIGSSPLKVGASAMHLERLQAMDANISFYGLVASLAYDATTPPAITAVCYPSAVKAC